MSATIERALDGVMQRAIPREVPRDGPVPRRETPRRPVRFPWPPLIALVLTALIGIAALLPAKPDTGEHVVAARELRPATQPDGAIKLIDTHTGAVAGEVPALGDSFVRGVLHGLEFQRKLHRVPLDAPYTLTAYQNGRLVLRDPGTRAAIDIEAFGQDNLASFAVMLKNLETAR